MGARLLRRSQPRGSSGPGQSRPRSTGNQKTAMKEKLRRRSSQTHVSQYAQPPRGHERLANPGQSAGEFAGSGALADPRLH
eukprot:3088579-Pyramimonas_sp.AAC.1